MVIKRLFFLVLLVAAAAPVMADEKADIKNIKKVFSQILPGQNPEVVSPSALPGMYEVVYGAQVMYMSGDGRYLMQGDVIDLSARENLTETTRSKQRLKMVQSLDTNTMIVFKPEGQTKHVLTVFTDIDCGYCRKLHKQMDDYLAKGIEVRYLAFPRAGMNSKSYYKAVSVWCSDDKQRAITKAKAGITPKRQDCDNPVVEHMKLAEQFGVTGTPTLVLENGEVIPGYVAPARLSAMLNNMKASL